jgi:hypothetical protein
MPTIETFFKNIYLNIPYDAIKHIIGKNGSNFTKISAKNNLNYMWYNKDANAITMYGPTEVLPIAYKNICNVIEGYVKKFAPDFCKNIYNTNTMDDKMTELSLKDSLVEEDVKVLIGINGIIFKEITRKSNVYFIWYNNQSHSIHIWGSKFHTINAIRLLQTHVNAIIKKKENKIEIPNDESRKRQRVE